MANPYTDPRNIAARLGQIQPARTGLNLTGPTPSKASIELGRAANRFSIQNPELRAQIEAIAGGGAAAKPKGLVGSVLGNSFVKTGLNALNVFSIPGKAVVSTVKEVGQALDSDESDGFSLGDIVKDVKDPTFGFGKAFKVDTGNIWVDRAIGFVGDVALDPLTYATLGTGKMAGLGGRLEGAAQVLKLTGDAALAKRVQVYGRAAKGLTPEIAELAGYNRAGVYFLGKRIKVGKMQQGLRLPGSGAIGMLGDSMMAKLRVSASKSKAYERILRMTTPTDHYTARLALARGEAVSDDAAAALIGYFSADPVTRKAQAIALQNAQKKTLDLLRSQETRGLNVHGRIVGELIEDADAFARATPEAQQAAQEWIDLFAGFEDEITQALKSVDPDIDTAARFVQRYFPRIVSGDGIAYMGDVAKPHSGGLRSIFARDPLAGGRNFKSRTLEVGDDFFGQKLSADDLKSTARLNEIARNGGFVGDFFEMDVSKVAAKYADEFAKESGLLARHKHLVDTGFWKRAEEVTANGEIIDKELIDSIKRNIKSLDDDILNMQKQAATAVAAVQTNLKLLRQQMVEAIGEQQRALAGMEGLARSFDDIGDVLGGSASLGAEQIDNVANLLGDMKQKFAKMMGGEFKNGKIVVKTATGVDDSPIAADGLVAYLDNLESDLRQMHDDIADMASGKTGVELEEAAKSAEEAVRAMQLRLQEASDRMRVTFEFGNQLENAMTAATKGESLLEFNSQVIDAVNLISKDGTVGAEKIQQIIDERFNVIGKVQDFIREHIASGESVFDDLTAMAPINKDSVIKFSENDLHSVMMRIYDVSLPTYDVRRAALYSLIMDERLYGANIPATVQEVRYRLLDAMRRTDEAIAYQTSVVLRSGERQTGRTVLDGQMLPKYEEVLSYDEEIANIDSFLANEGQKILENPQLLDVDITEELLDSIIPNAKVKYPWLSEFVTGGEENWADLMNSNLDATYGRRASNVPRSEESFARQANTEFVDVQQFGTAEQTLTLGDIIAKAKSRRDALNASMDSVEVFRFGSGVSERTFTGRQLIEHVEKYNALKARVSALNSARKAFVEDFLNENGYYKLVDKVTEEELAAIKGVSPSSITTKEIRAYNKGLAAANEAKRESIMARARIYADAQDFSPERIDYFTKRGYFDMPGGKDAVASRKRMRADFDAEQLAIQENRLRQGQVSYAERRFAQGRRGRNQYGDILSGLRDEIDAMAGTGELLRPEWFTSVDKTQKELRGALMDYVIVSEVHARYGALKAISASSGYAPSKSGFGAIISAVASKYMPRIESRLANVESARIIMKRMDESIAASLRDSIDDAVSGLTPAQAFKSAFAALSNRDIDILREVFGDGIAVMDDAYTLRKGLAASKAGKSTAPREVVLNADGTPKLNKKGRPITVKMSEATEAQNEFFQSRVRPWFEANFPGQTANKQNMQRALMQEAPSVGKRAKMGRGPSSPDATVRDIKDWFETHVGYSSLPGRSNMSGTRNVVGREASVLDRTIKELRQARERYAAMLLPDLDVGQFFDNPAMRQKTPTWYAQVLRDQADELEASIARREAIKGDVRDMRAEYNAPGGVRDTAQQAQVEARRVQLTLQNIDDLQAEYEQIQKTIRELETNKRSNYKFTPEDEALLATSKKRAIFLKRELEPVAKAVETKTRIVETERRISTLIRKNAERRASEAEIMELAEKRQLLVELRKQRAKDVPLPKKAKDAISRGKSKTKNIAERQIAVAAQQEELDALRAEGRALTNKKRTKAGLTKREQSRLNAVRKRTLTLDAQIKEAMKDAPKVSPFERDVLSIPQQNRSSTVIAEQAQEYQARLASPVHAKATSDKEIVDAMTQLAHFDLSKFTDGFVGPDGVYATMPDGTRIVFSKAEAEALYVASYRPGEIGKMRQEIDAVVDTLTKERDVARERLAVLEGRYEGYKQRRAAMREAGSKRMLQTTKEETTILQKIAAQRSIIAANTKQIDSLVARRKSVALVNRNSALMKMKYLVHGRDLAIAEEAIQGAGASGARQASPRIFDAEGLSRFLNFDHMTQRYVARTQIPGARISIRDHFIYAGFIVNDNVQQRISNVMSQWMLSPEKAHLDEMSKLENGIVMRLHASTIDDAAKATALAAEVNSAIKAEVRRYIDAGAPIEEARTRAQGTAEIIDEMSIDRTGVGIGEPLNAKQKTSPIKVDAPTSAMPESHAGFIADDQQRWAGVSQEAYGKDLTNKKTGKTRTVTVENQYLTKEEQAQSMLADGLKTPEDFRAFADRTIEQYTPSGRVVEPVSEMPTRVDPNSPGAAFQGIDTATSNAEYIRSIHEPKIARLEAALAEAEAATYPTSAGKNRAVSAAKNRLDAARKAYENDMITSGGRRAVLEDYTKVREGFDVVRERRMVDGKEEIVERYIPRKEMSEYSAARETADQWAAKNGKEAVEQARKRWDEKAASIRTVRDIVDAIKRRGVAAESEIALKYGSIDQLWDEIYNKRGHIDALQQGLKDIDDLVAKMPPSEAKATLMRALGKGSKGGKRVKPVSGERIDEALAQYRAWFADNDSTIKRIVNSMGRGDDDPVLMAWASAMQHDAELIWMNLEKSSQLEALAMASAPYWGTVVIKPFADDWQKAAEKSGLLRHMTMLDQEGFGPTASTGFPGLMGNREAVELLRNVARIEKPGVVDDLSKFMSGYTGFFRAYATLSPGFHVRNSISNIFSIFAAGAEIRNMREGFKMWKLFDHELRNGGTVDSFVKMLPDSQKEIGRVAAETVLGLGGGRIDNALEGFVRGGSRITDNRMLDVSRNAGHRAEGSARFMLAYDSLAQGMNPNQTFNRTKRYLIDYGQKTVLDEYMRDIIPFWTWMSRNIPYQVMNRWTNPKPYLIYQDFQTNMAYGRDENSVVPKYLQESGAVQLGENMFFSPDLPFSRVDQQIQELAQPRKLLSYINPGVRAPVEFLMNTNSYTGKPFKDKFIPVNGALLPFLPALKAAGQVEYDNTGQAFINDRAMSLLMNMVPPLGRAERLFPGEGTEGAKTTNPWLSFAGIPITNVDEQSRNSELMRRLALMQEFQTRQQALGKAR